MAETKKATVAKAATTTAKKAPAKKAPAKAAAKKAPAKKSSVKFDKLKGKTKNTSIALAKINAKESYTIEEAAKLVKETSFTKFDATVNVSYKLGLDPRQAEQQIRASLVLPHGTGKTKKVLVIAKGPQAAAAEKAGADFVGQEDLLKRIKEENWWDFDIIVASPDMMPVLGKYGRMLGPKGLMPNPKTGTVTPNVAQAIENIKKGQIEYRLDKEANIHSIIGKASFTADKLVDNFNAINDAIKAAKPSTAKGKYMQTVTISATMGPAIKINVE